jgi:diguanylate cyclase (GGDEF)-like protein/PAS domain S-box-containing protein
MISPIRDAGGEVRYFLSMGRDMMTHRPMDGLFSLLADHAPVGVYVLARGKFMYVNQHFERYTGYRLAELEGQEWSLLVLPEDRDRVRRSAVAMLKSGHVEPYEYRITAKDGRVRWFSESVRSVQYRGVRSVGGIFTDITDQKLAGQKLENALSLYAATMESTADGILTIDLSGRVVSHNNRFLSMWNVTPGKSDDVNEMLETVLPQLTDPKDFLARARELIRNGGDSLDTLELKDGRVFERYSRPQMIDGEYVGRVWSFRDITERKQFEARLLHMASYDSLTGVLNRRRFQEEIEEAQRAVRTDGPRGALLLLDIDRFKDINDTLGHQAGDEVLVQLAAVLKETLPGHIVARFGGDEFAIFLKDLSPTAAREAADRLRWAIAHHAFGTGGRQMSLTASIGIAILGRGLSIGELLSHADLAMYEAKGRGRNRINAFSTRLLTRSRTQLRRDWQNRVCDAVENGRLSLYCRPVVSLTTGEVAHHELQVRLATQQGRFLATGRILALAEQAGVRKQVDRWLISQAIELQKKLAQRPDRVAVAVDLSSWALADSEMTDYIGRTLRETRVDPRSIIVGFAETGAFSEPAGPPSAVQTLRSLGLRTALLHFGAGASSLADLKRLPVDMLNIDESFIWQLATNDADRTIAGAIVATARGMDIETVAENVRDEATLAAARDLGIDYGDGTYLGRARPVSALLRAPPAVRAA